MPRLGYRRTFSIATLTALAILVGAAAAAPAEARVVRAPEVRAQDVQEQGKRIRIELEAGAGELVNFVARGWVLESGRKLRLHRSLGSVAAGRSAELELRPRKARHERRIKRALAGGRELEARIRVKLSDLTGSKVKRKLTVRLT